jgi:hypothetical protein
MAAQQDGQFTTTNTRFACYILAANILRYLRAESGGHEVAFVFLDPDGAGEEHWRNWRAGIVSLVNPKTILEVRERLIDDVKRVKNGGAR